MGSGTKRGKFYRGVFVFPIKDKNPPEEKKRRKEGPPNRGKKGRGRIPEEKTKGKGGWVFLFLQKLLP